MCGPGFFSREDGIDVINYSAGIPGPPGEQGPPGPPGRSNIFNAVLVEDDYIVNHTDTYIGVSTKKPIEILLPVNPSEGTTLVVKLEMGPPIGNRKVTIIADSTIKIDDKSSYIMENPYESVTLVYRGTEWRVI
jgi:hypothetical protein